MKAVSHIFLILALAFSGAAFADCPAVKIGKQTVKFKYNDKTFRYQISLHKGLSKVILTEGLDAPVKCDDVVVSPEGGVIVWTGMNSSVTRSVLSSYNLKTGLTTHIETDPDTKVSRVMKFKVSSSGKHIAFLTIDSDTSKVKLWGGTVDGSAIKLITSNLIWHNRYVASIEMNGSLYPLGIRFDQTLENSYYVNKARQLVTFNVVSGTSKVVVEKFFDDGDSSSQHSGYFTIDDPNRRVLVTLQSSGATVDLVQISFGSLTRKVLAKNVLAKPSCQYAEGFLEAAACSRDKGGVAACPNSSDVVFRRANDSKAEAIWKLTSQGEVRLTDHFQFAWFIPEVRNHCALNKLRTDGLPYFKTGDDPK